MKKLLKVKFALLIAMLLSTLACEQSDPVDESISVCDAKENQIPSTEITFRNLGVNVYWKNSTPAEGLSVQIQMRMENCEGNTGGYLPQEEFYPDRFTSDDGWWLSSRDFTYAYKNKKDKVLLRISIIESDIWVYNYVYTWEDVDGSWENNIVTDAKIINLPVNEDGS